MIVTRRQCLLAERETNPAYPFSAIPLTGGRRLACPPIQLLANIDQVVEAAKK